MQLSEYTAKTLGREEVLRQIREVSSIGYAVDDEEHDEGIRCVAAPVFDYREKIIAAVSVAGPAAAITPSKDKETALLLIETARNISKRMGYK